MDIDRIRYLVVSALFIEDGREVIEIVVDDPTNINSRIEMDLLGSPIDIGYGPKTYSIKRLGGKLLDAKIKGIDKADLELLTPMEKVLYEQAVSLKQVSYALKIVQRAKERFISTLPPDIDVDEGSLENVSPFPPPAPQVIPEVEVVVGDSRAVPPSPQVDPESEVVAEDSKGASPTSSPADASDSLSPSKVFLDDSVSIPRSKRSSKKRSSKGVVPPES